MILQEIVTYIQRNKWIHTCNRFNIDVWDLVKYTQEKVYISAKFSTSKTKVSTEAKECLICDTPFKVRNINGYFIIKKMCNCFSDEKNISKNKLSCFMSTDEAEKIINNINQRKRAGLATTADYWKTTKLSDNEIKIKISEIQKIRSKKSPSTTKGVREYSIRCKEYWMRLGFTEKESIEKIKNIQTTNGIDFYTSKYGEVVGKIMLADRIDRWLSTLSNKEDIKDINKSKGRTKNQIIEKIGFEEYIKYEVARVEKIVNTKINRAQIASKDDLIEKIVYQEKVRYYTRKSLTHFYDILNPQRLPISYELNHIDHIYSKSSGFINNVPPEIIGSYVNLRVIPRKDNMCKFTRSDITLEKLLETYESIDENWRIIVKNARI